MQNLEKLREIEFDRREKRLENAIQQELIYNARKREYLTITYVMTWTGICGGSKIILEHANRLVAMGHKVNLISHFPKPDWFVLDKKVKFIQVSWKNILCESIPQCDVIVATYWREIYECIEQKIAPVVYFEQGDYHLFDLNKLDKRTFDYINKQLETVKYVYTVSSFAQEKIKSIYGKESIIIPNAVDEKVFFYKEHPDNEIMQITIIGSEEAEFKRISNILKAIRELKARGYRINLNWITPTKPLINKEDAIINPKQIVIGDTLRNTDIYICASLYESFCLPVLEAMTCGAAVITTNNGGNMDFVKDKVNVLLIEKDNILDIIEKVELLINDSENRKKIASEGAKTSQEYSWNRTMNEIVKYYADVANYQIKRA